MDAEQLVDLGKQVVKIKYPLIRAVFDDFDRRVLDELLKRKWIGRHFRSNAHYYNWLKREERERKAKESDVSNDMITEGIMKMGKLATTKTFT